MTSSNSQHPKPEQLSYRDAGVNIDAGNLLVEKIKPFAQRTWRPEILAGIGGFGALFEVPQKYRNPVLVSGTDGVGTKLKVAFQFNQHDSIGIDLVAMSVNDILVQGAEPLFFLDYFACGSLNVDTATRVVQGIAAGCEQAGCALIGGETAEMPGMYPEGEYDLAGFAVGIVEKSSIINGSTISENDIILGIASNGAHANGFSLIRKIIEKHPVDLNAKLGNSTLIETIMAPTRIYVKPVLELIRKLPVKGLAHITGGGLLENIPRILPTGMMVDIQKDSWEIPLLFPWLQQQGNVANEEMFRVFNCGIGMVLVVAPEHADEAMAVLHACGETVWRIGHIKQRHADEPAILIA
ncbi:phosphoribosylformylglycinamidine cyclo-ligase [Nitrosomonas sp. Nm58]|uniref:phosphoribosylformylglycinamidine cyclo-ligase n=1 Tax=Nitrosomonas sp. Nm58 TaxID=200126 RepID=UPI00089A7243|nr:phosphoribosylformylglycinamidine cyclo-ligase [Nitrosomonas sp. Nm58]SDY31349.1 phosphoribosylformylglycinamidine cyclo-ligase [Nitrosomonas sp. Nm58]